MNLLIVDDDATNRKLLRAQLEAVGHRVLDATNGVEALRVLDKEKSVDGIVSDILMPDMDGFQLCLEVRKNKKVSALPFIFYTSTYSSPQDQQLAKTVGADNYLSKPSPTPVILAALQDAAQRTRPRIAAAAAQQDETYVLRQDQLALVRKLEQRNVELEEALGKLRESEQQLRLFVEHAPAAIAMLDNNMRYLAVSRRWLADYRVGEQDILGRSHYDVFPEIPESWKEIHRRCLAGAVEKREEDPFPRADGNLDWVRWEIRPWYKGQDEIGGIILFSELITARKLAEEARRESEQRFQQITENIREVFWLTNPSKNEMLYVSPAYDIIWGRPRDALYSSPQSWLDAIHSEDREHVLRAVDNDQIAGTYDQEYRIVRPDGTLRWIHDRAFPVRDMAGKVYRVAGVAEDITERKQAEIKITGLNRVYAVLSGINTLIVRVNNRQELFDEACRIAVEQGGFALSWIGTLDAQTLDITPLAWAGEGAEEYLSRTSITARADVPEGRGILGSAMRERRPVFTNDISVETFTAGSERRKEAIRRGFRSVIALPLIAEASVIGCFSLFSKESGVFNEEEVRLLVELAGDISFALENISRQQKLGKLARIRAVSSEINAAIVRIRDRELLLKETCRIATENGKFEMIWIGTVDTKMQEIRAVAWTGFSPEVAGKVSWKSAGSAQGTLSEAIRTRKPAARNNIETQLPEGRMRSEAVRQGCRSTVCLPLVVDDRVVALIVLFAAGIDFFDKDELELLDEVAADVSFALQSIAQQEKVQYLSYYDPLTALPNRSLFIDRLSQQLHGRGEERPMVAVILLNLERFRNINDTLGRHGGDELLKLVALRLENAFHGKDYLARIGADGFGVVIRGIRDTGAAAHTVQDQVLGCFHEPFRLNGSELRVAAKAGVAIFPRDGEDADALFRNAEAALKKARDSGERYLFYAADMNARAAQVLSLETRLRRAVEAQQFVLHYQPKIALAGGRICGLEALIRWQDPASGLVAPGAFIPLLEETGLILEVGKWALGQALTQHRDWTARGCNPPRIAVNVSAIQLQQKDFSDVVISVLQAQGDNPDALELEVTESLLMKDVQSSIRKLSILRGLGIHIAMDDFGTGYSSLSYLARLPINSLKIDRSFIIGMAGNPQDMSIVSTIIALAHSLNLRVVAEGVETEDQSKLLMLLKCDEAQGYLFSKPLPPDQIEVLLRDWQKKK